MLDESVTELSNSYKMGDLPEASILDQCWQKLEEDDKPSPMITRLGSTMSKA